MNEQVHSTNASIRQRAPAPPLADAGDVDHLAREQAMRERDYERRRAAHPDPSDPEHPDELEGAI